ncbi:accessory gene regulator B family protein [Clostridium paraputrificum]|uniref:accessory gene regulator ArgB-like protein n=1 Tax=Clostridium TaxID=1485 RepID=UPI00041C0DB9|nr:MULTISPECIES: accessory gene regulator B family protein [Clostridium]MDB2090181.1 accessory gene regulator B family protein [Clostridium paraputrificum]MDB2096597.1 accessory gene regulator B family protein [Clostridium paraputrificum]MDB2110520.1 accessory gene regulator B family protein [Clostridium paraputrificum]MDU1179254.1 accessory gene regulator B family protein [Clostridium sp.]MDU1226256.1 accessory gene regulator B family protein [Clostridium sp.]
MLGVEKLCKRLSSFISKELDLEKDKEAVVNYGIFSLIQIFISIGLVIVFGLIFGVLIEALIASFTGSLLRKSSGGVHADSPGKCTAIGTVMCVGIGLISKKIDISISLMILIEICIFIWSYIIIFKYAPIDSLAKPIKKEEKRMKLKKASIVILTIYLIIITLNTILFHLSGEEKYIVYSLCMCFSIIWQVFSLTKSAHYLFGKN